MKLIPFAIFFIITAQFPLLAQAQTAQQAQQSASRQASASRRPVFRWAKKPSRLSTIPGRGVGMGSRDDCPAVKNPLIALAPFKQAGTKSLEVGGLTTTERPTFWFYLPYSQDFANVSAEFVLQDSEENDVYKNAIALPKTAGVVGVPLPSTVAPLEVGKTYRWFFKVYCTKEAGSPPINVEGDIQRVTLEANEESQLAAAKDPREKISIYAASGIWFDSLTQLTKLRFQNPNDTSLVADWQSLLQSIGLENVANASLVTTER
ncbi:MAG: DUF928 domain-containing protein [Scytonematopsis contorta HA4267-MV1]|jgi:hypothetical protein|nr:DUF928 domain-containing protein [Scytonematopsis contorta HA4267-MV1]